MRKENELKMTVRFRMDNPEHRRLYEGLSRRRDATKQSINAMVMDALDLYLQSNGIFHVGWEETIRDIIHSELERAKLSWSGSVTIASGASESLDRNEAFSDAIETDPEDLDDLITGLGF